MTAPEDQAATIAELERDVERLKKRPGHIELARALDERDAANATIAELREQFAQAKALYLETLNRATAAESALVESEAKLCDFVVLLASRDMWIVDKGLWHAFVEDVAEYHKRAENSDLSEYAAPASARLTADVLGAADAFWTKFPNTDFGYEVFEGDDPEFLALIDDIQTAVAKWREGE